MIWDFLKNIIRKKNSKPDKKEWLYKLVDNLETQWIQDAKLPFKIIELKRTGFVVKVSGLFAFISFNHMPWKYKKVNYWSSIFPKLIGKVFFCQIHSIDKVPSLSIIVNGEIPQFKKTELIIGENYKGVIIEKRKKGIFVEIGCHFDWKCGSFIGYLNKSGFDSLQLFSTCSVGDEIEVFYQGVGEKGPLIFSQSNEEIVDWNNKIPQGLVGQVVLVHIVREAEKEMKFLVKGKYKGRIYLEKNDPFFGSKKRARKVKNKLKDGTIIHCEVIGFRENLRFLRIKWIAELDTKIIDREDIRVGIKRSVMNNLDDSTVQKMMKIRDEIESREIHFR